MRQLQKTSNNKPEVVFYEISDIRVNKEEPQYMEIFKIAHSTVADKVTMQVNPSYSISSDNQVKTQYNPSYSIPTFTKH